MLRTWHQVRALPQPNRAPFQIHDTVDPPLHIQQSDRIRRPRQTITAARTLGGVQDSRPAEVTEHLSEIRRRKILRLGDDRQPDKGLGRRRRKKGQRTNGVFAGRRVQHSRLVFRVHPPSTAQYSLACPALLQARENDSASLIVLTHTYRKAQDASASPPHDSRQRAPEASRDRWRRMTRPTRASLGSNDILRPTRDAGYKADEGRQPRCQRDEDEIPGNELQKRQLQGT